MPKIKSVRVLYGTIKNTIKTPSALKMHMYVTKVMAIALRLPNFLSSLGVSVHDQKSLNLIGSEASIFFKSSTISTLSLFMEKGKTIKHTGITMYIIQRTIMMCPNKPKTLPKIKK
jgi:hypothetical protein